MENLFVPFVVWELYDIITLEIRRVNKTLIRAPSRLVNFFYELATNEVIKVGTGGVQRNKFHVPVTVHLNGPIIVTWRKKVHCNT